MKAPPRIFDRVLLRSRAMRASQQAEAQSDADFLILEMATRLVDRLLDVRRKFPLALELGARNSVVAKKGYESGKIGKLVQTHSFLCAGDEKEALSLVADEELLPFADHSFELILSCGSLHTVNDLPGTLAQICRVLKPDGLFLAMLPGGQTLHELRDAFTAASLSTEQGLSPRVYPFLDVRDAGMLLQRAGFSLPVVDSERITVRYQHPLKLLADLRSMGESSTLTERSRLPLKRETLKAMVAAYQQKWAEEEDGRIPATFEFITLTAWKPHASQQQPAARGSAKVSLTDVLN